MKTEEGLPAVQDDTLSSQISAIMSHTTQNNMIGNRNHVFIISSYDSIFEPRTNVLVTRMSKKYERSFAT